MRKGTQAELNRIIAQAHVTNEKTCSGNPRGRNEQIITYKYCSAIVAVKRKTFRGNKEVSVEIEVHPLFVEHSAHDAYALYLKG